MEKEEIKNIWKNIDDSSIKINYQEINKILIKKNKKIMKKIQLNLALSIVLSLGMITYLVITSISRFSDYYLLTINSILFVMTLAFLISYLRYFKNIQGFDTTKGNLKETMKDKIHMLRNSTKRFKYGFVVVGFYFVLLIISIHVFFENKFFVTVFDETESIWGLLFGVLIGAIVTFTVFRKYLKYYDENILRMEENLKDLK
ncbi:MAG: hypothetical protein JEY97_00735 [Bacteroidales bacterium]|nr:hypothetical protein [Bacteroidales bacterium]